MCLLVPSALYFIQVNNNANNVFVSWKMFLSVLTQPEGISLQAKDSTLSSPLLLRLTVLLHQLLGRSQIPVGLV